MRNTIYVVLLLCLSACVPDNSIVNGTSVPLATQPPACVGGVWTNLDTNELTHAGLGLREPNAFNVYGWAMGPDEAVVFPKCAYFSTTVRVPVLMVDWEDFNPATDLSNAGNPLSDFPNYVPSTPQALQEYLNGPSGPAQYFKDVSAGQTQLVFEVFGWLRSDTPDSYLRPRSEYLDAAGSCDRRGVFLDAVRDAVVQFGVDLDQYDADGNGVMDGAVLVYEGHPGKCSGTNLSTAGGSTQSSSASSGFNFPRGSELVSNSDPNWALFAGQTLPFNLYNNMPERSNNKNEFVTVNTWAHELGHLYLGFPDYYKTYFNIGVWAQSANMGYHPAAFEKWLFARWIEPQIISDSGNYTLRANEVPDGAPYSTGTYLYRIDIDNDPRRFLTIENRWFDDAGNNLSSWADSRGRESGLTIIEYDLSKTYSNQISPQLYRHSPQRATDAEQKLAAFGPGEYFGKCFSTECITVYNISSAGAQVSFGVDIKPVPVQLSVTIDAPKSGDFIAGIRNVYVTASANTTKVQLAVVGDSTQIDTIAPYQFKWDTTALADGTYYLMAAAEDKYGNVVTSDPVTVTVDNTGDIAPPSVFIYAPTEGATVDAPTTQIIVYALDNIGVSKVEIWIDNILTNTIESPTSENSYQYSWDTTELSPGQHTLTAKAFDAANNVNQQGVTVIK